jgi:hypothetical protein
LYYYFQFFNFITLAITHEASRQAGQKSTAHYIAQKYKKKQFNKKSTSTLLVAQALVRRFFGKKIVFFPNLYPFLQTQVRHTKSIFQVFLEKI